jgi:hypothetical protein
MSAGYIQTMRILVMPSINVTIQNGTPSDYNVTVWDEWLNGHRVIANSIALASGDVGGPFVINANNQNHGTIGYSCVAAGGVGGPTLSGIDVTDGTQVQIF